jgi:hypothetical protein
VRLLRAQQRVETLGREQAPDEDGPLAEHVPAHLARLTDGRYASNPGARSLGARSHFAHWMATCRLSADWLDESRGCAGPAVRHSRDAHAALMLLLALLRQRDVISDLPSPTGPIADEFARYDARMRDARGLSAGTRRSQVRIVQRLLLDKSTSSLAGRSGSSGWRPRKCAASLPNSSSCATRRATS